MVELDKKTKAKYIVGIYAAAFSIMGMLVPVPIVAQVAATFPNENIAAVQMVVSIIPLFMAISAMLVSSLLAPRILKKRTLLVAHCIYVLAGLAVFFFMHNSLAQILVGSSFIGIAVGAVQNSSDALIADYFEGKSRSFVMGFYSTFVALGGVLWVGLSSALGADNWVNSYLAYLGMIPLIIIEAICLPNGHLEPKHEKNVFSAMPKEVAIITVVSFVFVMCFQLFNTNSSLIIAARGMGGVAEAGTVTSIVSLAGIVAGLIVGALYAKFKNLSMPISWCITLVGLVLALTAPDLGMMCAAGFIASLGKESYVPNEGNFAAGNSAPEGRAFNLAIGMAGINFGMALSPLVFEALSTPFGNTIESKFALGIAICLVLIVFGFIHYRKLTPAQLAEQERIEAAKAAKAE